MVFFSPPISQPKALLGAVMITRLEHPPMELMELLGSSKSQNWQPQRGSSSSPQFGLSLGLSVLIFLAFGLSFGNLLIPESKDSQMASAGNCYPKAVFNGSVVAWMILLKKPSGDTMTLGVLENGPFIRDFPIQTSIHRGFSSHVWLPEGKTTCSPLFHLFQPAFHHRGRVAFFSAEEKEAFFAASNRRLQEDVATEDVVDIQYSTLAGSRSLWGNRKWLIQRQWIRKD